MFRLTPQLLIATARALTGLQVRSRDFERADEPEPRGGCDDDHHSWDAQFVLACGYWSHYEHRTRQSAWPIPLDLTTPQLAAFGQDRDVVHDEPEPGDIFLQWNPRRKAFIHCGIVLDVLDLHQISGSAVFCDLYTVEGDTDANGQLSGGKAMRVKRRLSPKMGDRFLRWVDLDFFNTVRDSMAQISTHRASSAQDITAEEKQAVATAWPELEESIKWFANAFSSDSDDRADLLQEARIRLWKADPTRYNPRSRRDMLYLRRIVINHMCDVRGFNRVDPDEDIWSLTFDGVRLSDLRRLAEDDGG